MACLIERSVVMAAVAGASRDVQPRTGNRDVPGLLSPSEIHILLVDDEKLSRIVVGNLLRKCNYKVTLAASGSEALDVLRASAPGTFQLVLTDVMMPDVDGVELLRFVRSNGAWRDVPVVMMSANEHKDTVFECISNGAEEYLVKPVTKKEVQNIWQHVWRRVTSYQQLEAPEADRAAPSSPRAWQSGVSTNTGDPAFAAGAAGDSPPVPAALPDSTKPEQVANVGGSNSCMNGVSARQAVTKRRKAAADYCQLSRWLLRPSRTIDRQESAWIFCEALLLLLEGTLPGRDTGRVLHPGVLLLHKNGQVTYSESVQDDDSGAAAYYRSPELAAGNPATTSSDAFSLGILSFELFYPVTEGDRAALLSDLRQRILPPAFLRSCPQEVALILSMLHPDPQGRPTLEDLRSSEKFSSICDTLQRCRAARKQKESFAESEVLSDFLKLMYQKKLKEVSYVERGFESLRHELWQVKNHLQACSPAVDTTSGRENCTVVEPASKRQRMDGSTVTAQKDESFAGKWQRVVGVFPQLETAFFKKKQKLLSQPTVQAGGSQSPIVDNEGKLPDYLYEFAEDLSNFTKFKKFEVRATLRYGDLLNTSNMVCSTAFDRDDEFFATAGVSKRIKIFEYAGVVDSDVGVHYPVLEITSRSRLSNVCWSSYVKSHLVCSDYEGVLQLWDTNTNTELMQFEEHAKRVWSVDFSRVDPTRILSGSDDGTVRLWSINQECSVATIDTKANVCSVQFSPECSNIVAFGSANYRIYLYDLRNIDQPLAMIPGHSRAVSYVRFLGGNHLVSASTDNTLKMWDISSAACGNDIPCDITFGGHINEKNFVGLAVTSDGYIACGSENNTVYCYYKALPMPMLSHPFGSIDGSGLEDLVDHNQFVSSVCWSRKNDVLLTANSTGSIRVLSLV